ncbi:DUF6282 family protein [Bacillus licheniformis]
MRKMFPEVSIFGSIALNYQVGGINVHAVEAALGLGAKTVWLPTLHAKRHREAEGKSGGVETVNGNKVVPELREVLKLIAEKNAILGTGHLSPREIFIIVEEAKNKG